MFGNINSEISQACRAVLLNGSRSTGVLCLEKTRERSGTGSPATARTRRKLDSARLLCNRLILVEWSFQTKAFKQSGRIACWAILQPVTAQGERSWRIITGVEALSSTRPPPAPTSHIHPPLHLHQPRLSRLPSTPTRAIAPSALLRTHFPPLQPHRPACPPCPPQQQRRCRW